MKRPGTEVANFFPHPRLSYPISRTVPPVTQRPTPNKQLTMGFKRDKKKN